MARHPPERLARGHAASRQRRAAQPARLTHFFGSREALLVQALRSAHFAAGARMVAAAPNLSGDLKRLETLVLEVLPPDAERMNEWKTPLTFWEKHVTTKSSVTRTPGALESGENCWRNTWRR